MNRWPQQLVPQLLRYLEIHRPLLLAGRYEGQALRVSGRPGALADYAVTTRTKAALGKSVTPLSCAERYVSL